MKNVKRDNYCGTIRDFKIRKSLLEDRKRVFEYEKAGNVARIRYGGKTELYMDKGNSLFSHLCKKVNRDVDEWLETFKESKSDIEKVSPVIYYNKDLIKGLVGGPSVVGIDINACYWNIAYKLDIISKETYEFGLNKKEARLVAIGNLAKKKYIRKYFPDGSYTKKVILNKRIIAWYSILVFVNTIFNRINNKCGDDVVSWLTDCVYLRSDSEFIPFVEDVFKSAGLTVKYEKIGIIGVSKHKVDVFKYKDQTKTWWSTSVVNN